MCCFPSDIYASLSKARPNIGTKVSKKRRRASFLAAERWFSACAVRIQTLFSSGGNHCCGSNQARTALSCSRLRHLKNDNTGHELHCSCLSLRHLNFNLLLELAASQKTTPKVQGSPPVWSTGSTSRSSRQGKESRRGLNSRRGPVGTAARTSPVGLAPSRSLRKLPSRTSRVAFLSGLKAVYLATCGVAKRRRRFGNQKIRTRV